MADPKIVEVPGIGNVEFPGEMSDDAIAGAIRGNLAQQSLESARANLIKGMNSQRTEFERQRDPANQPGFWSSAVNTLGSMIPGVNGQPIVQGLGGAANQGLGLGLNAVQGDVERQTQGRSLPYRALAQIPVAPSREMERQADIGNARGVAGIASGTAAPVVAGALYGALQGSRVPGQASLPKPIAVEKLVQAIETDPKAMPGVRANLSNTIDLIKTHAKNTGQPINGIEDLAKVTAEAAKSNPYRNTFIEPNKGVELQAPGNFKGRTFDYGRTTIGDMDARLSEINDTLRPKMTKGGAGSPTAQAAIGAENAAELNAEAVKIRSVMAKEIGKRMGIDPELVRRARGQYGQLDDLAYRFKLEADSRAQQRAILQNTPLRVRDIPRKLGEIPVNPRNWIGGISDRAIKSVFDSYSPGGTQTVQSVAPGSPAPRLPSWQGKTTSQPVSGFRLPSPEETADAQSIQRGRLNYRANVNARNAEAKAQSIAEKLKRHGKGY